MPSLLRLAWRNLGRNRRRTVITGSALAVGIALSVSTYGLVDGIQVQLLTALTQYDIGHLQVHQRDYPRRRSMSDVVPDGRRLMTRLRAAAPVVAASPRVYAFALVSHGGRSLGVQLIGLDPRSEPHVTTLHEQVHRGRGLPPEPTQWPGGRRLTAKERQIDRALTRRAEKRAFDELDQLQPLQGGKSKAVRQRSAAASRPADRGESVRLTRQLALAQSPQPDRPPQVVIGAQLADLLGLGIGDELYVITQALDGAQAEVTAGVRGVLETGTAQYDRRVYFHIADLQRLTRIGDHFHEIAAKLRQPQRARAVAARLRKQLDLPSDARLRSWEEIRPDISAILRANRGSTLVTVLIILLMATIGVINTMLMSVFERTRELGVLKAIGMSAGRVLGMVVIETCLLGFGGALVGSALGLGLDVYLVHYGIDLSAFSRGISIGGIGFSPVLRATITVRSVLEPTVVLAVCCLLASLFPAIRAARLRPAVGMRDL